MGIRSTFLISPRAQRTSPVRDLILLTCMLIAVTPVSIAQTVTGQLTGTVVDSAGGTVAGASVQITNEVTGQVRQFPTGSNGGFIFPDLVPGTYDLRISQSGF